MNLFPAIVGMAAVVVASNILVQFLLGQWLTWGALSYPVAFLITDLTNRYHGAQAARKVVLAGFVTGLICSLIGTQIEGEFGPLVTLRVALASGTGFLIAQMIDVQIFDRLRAGSWWRAPLISSIIGTVADTVLFFVIAFSLSLTWIEPSNDVAWANEVLPLLGFGPDVYLWQSLAVADWLVKMALVFVALIPFGLIARKVKTNLA